MENTETIAQLTHTIKTEIAHAVIGQSQVVEQMLIALIASGHVLHVTAGFDNTRVNAEEA